MKNSNPKKDLANIDAHPKQSLGQNFCLDHNILDKIARAAGIDAGDQVIEIGAGTGALTGHLADTGANVLALEIDGRFQEHLHQRFEQTQNVNIVMGDALELLPSILDQLPERVVVVGNLPYYASSPLIFAMVDHRAKIRRAIITLQNEVALRLVSSPNCKDYGILAVRLQAVCKPSLLFKIKPTCFFPPPRVESACVEFDFEKGPTGLYQDEQAFAAIVRAAFAQRRKQLRNSLSATYPVDSVDQALESAGISPAIRAENLTLEDFGRLADAMGKAMTTHQE